MRISGGGRDDSTHSGSMENLCGGQTALNDRKGHTAGKRTVPNLFGSGEQSAQITGKLQFEAQCASDYPAVGDYVLADCRDPHLAVIHQVLPRNSLFLRKAAGTAQREQVVAANVDTVFCA